MNTNRPAPAVIKPDPAWLAEFNRNMAAHHKRARRWATVCGVSLSCCLFFVLFTIAWPPSCVIALPFFALALEAGKRSL